MTNRTSVLVLIGALASCLLVAACVALGVGGYFYYINNGNPNPLAALTTNTPAAINRIVYVGNDFNIYTTDPAGGAPQALTTDGGGDHAYNYPTWSPDNHRLAFVGYTFTNGNPQEGALYTVSPAGENLTPVYKTTENFPFYLYWSPNSQVIGFLANKDTSHMALNIATSDIADSKQEIDIGSPFYWAWAPDGSQMFTHVGGTKSDNNDARLALLAPQGNNAPHPLQSAPGAFQAPQWSPNGKILYSTQTGSDQTIALSDAVGTDVKTLATYKGRASFALSPDAGDVAYLLTDASTRLTHFGLVRVVAASGENTRVISQEPSLAFLWSPDSTKLAYLTVELGTNQSNFNFDADPPAIASTAPEKLFRAPNSNQGGETRIQLHWNIWDRATNTSRIAATFVPTLSFLNTLPYFDQYANSTTFWSPDSQSLVYTASEGNNKGSVYIADAVGTANPRKIGDGVIAYWSWK